MTVGTTKIRSKIFFFANMTNILKKLTVGTTKMSRKMKLKREKSHWNLPKIEREKECQEDVVDEKKELFKKKIEKE